MLRSTFLSTWSTIKTPEDNWSFLNEDQVHRSCVGWVTSGHRKWLAPCTLTRCEDAQLRRLRMDGRKRYRQYSPHVRRSGSGISYFKRIVPSSGTQEWEGAVEEAIGRSRSPHASFQINFPKDQQDIYLSSGSGRVVQTGDRGELICRDIFYGLCLPRADWPQYRSKHA